MSTVTRIKGGWRVEGEVTKESEIVGEAAKTMTWDEKQEYFNTGKIPTRYLTN